MHNGEAHEVGRGVLLVGIAPLVASALTLILEKARYFILTASDAHSAARVLSAATHVSVVICRCMDVAEDGVTPLTVSVGYARSNVAVIALCSNPEHDHRDFPPWCFQLSPPYDARKLSRTLMDARFEAFARASL